MRRYESLNLLRIISMVWILLFHARIHYGFMIGIPVFDEIISIGAIGVTNFIILSGFLLREKYRTYAFGEKDKLILYIKKRLFGIYPVYIGMLIIAIIFLYRVPSRAELIRLLPIELTLTQTWFSPTVHNYLFNDNWWFLSVFLFLNMLFPVLNAIGNIFSRKQKLVILLILLFAAYYPYYYSISIGDTFLIYYTNPLFRIAEFSFGIIAADVARELNFKLVSGGRIVALFLAVVLMHFMYNKWGTNYNLYNLITLPCTFFWLLYAKKTDWVEKVSSSKIIKLTASLGLEIYLAQSFAVMLIDDKIARGGGELMFGVWQDFLIIAVFIGIIMHVYKYLFGIAYRKYSDFYRKRTER